MAVLRMRRSGKTCLLWISLAELGQQNAPDPLPSMYSICSICSRCPCGMSPNGRAATARCRGTEQIWHQQLIRLIQSGITVEFPGSIHPLHVYGLITP